MAVELQIRSDSRQARRDLGQLERSLNNIERNVSAQTSGFQRLGNAARTAAAVAATAFVALRSASGIARTTDQFRTLNAQLGLVTRNFRSVTTGATTAAAAQANALQDVNRIALQTGQTVQGVAEVYRRLGQTANEVGASQGDVARAARAISDAIAVSGADAGAANAAIIQLGQGLASGTLRGEELNSVLEQTPRLARAIADGVNAQLQSVRSVGELEELLQATGAGSQENVLEALRQGAVSLRAAGRESEIFRLNINGVNEELGFTIGQLRTVAGEGALTSDVVFASLLSQAEQLSDEFATFPVTFGRAFANLGTAVREFNRLLLQSLGFTGNFASQIDGIAQSVGRINEAARGLGDSLNFRNFGEAVRNEFQFLGSALLFVNDFASGVIAVFDHLYMVLVGASIVPDTIDEIVRQFASLPGRALSLVQNFVREINLTFSQLTTDVLFNIQNPEVLFNNIRRAINDTIAYARENPLEFAIDTALLITSLTSVVGLFQGQIATAVFAAFTSGSVRRGAIGIGRVVADEVGLFFNRLSTTLPTLLENAAVAAFAAGRAAGAFVERVAALLGTPNFWSTAATALSDAIIGAVTVASAGLIGALTSDRAGGTLNAIIPEGSSASDVALNLVGEALDLGFDTIDNTLVAILDALGPAGALVTTVAGLALIGGGAGGIRESIGNVVTAPTSIARLGGQRLQQGLSANALGRVNGELESLAGRLEANAAQINQATDAYGANSRQVRELEGRNLTYQNRIRALTGAQTRLQARVDNLAQSLNNATQRARDAFTNIATDTGGVVGAAIGFALGDEVSNAIAGFIQGPLREQAAVLEEQVATLRRTEQQIERALNTATGDRREQLLEGRENLRVQIEVAQSELDQLSQEIGTLPGWVEAGIRAATAFIGQGVGAAIGSLIANALVSSGIGSVVGGLMAAGFRAASAVLAPVGAIIAAGMRAATAPLAVVGSIIATAMRALTAIWAAIGAQIGGAASLQMRAGLVAGIAGNRIRSAFARFGGVFAGSAGTALSVAGAGLATTLTAAAATGAASFTATFLLLRNPPSWLEPFTSALNNFVASGFEAIFGGADTSAADDLNERINRDQLNRLSEIEQKLADPQTGETQIQVLEQIRDAIRSDLRTQGVRSFATGGRIRGAGTGTSDSIPAMVSNGEFIVNAEATRRHLPLLAKINGGNYDGFGNRVPVPGFQTGGSVGVSRGTAASLGFALLPNPFLGAIDGTLGLGGAGGGAGQREVPTRVMRAAQDILDQYPFLANEGTDAYYSGLEAFSNNVQSFFSDERGFFGNLFGSGPDFSGFDASLFAGDFTTAGDMLSTIFSDSGSRNFRGVDPFFRTLRDFQDLQAALAEAQYPGFRNGGLVENAEPGFFRRFFGGLASFARGLFDNLPVSGIANLLSGALGGGTAGSILRAIAASVSAGDLLGRLTGSENPVERLRNFDVVGNASTSVVDAVEAQLGESRGVIGNFFAGLGARDNRIPLEDQEKLDGFTQMAFQAGGLVDANSPILRQIQAEEDFSPIAYLDSRNFPTIGYGQLLSNTALDEDALARQYGHLRVTEGQALQNAIDYLNNSAVPDARRFAGADVYDTLPRAVQDVLISSAYNLGGSRIQAFKNFKASVRARDFSDAAFNLLDSTAATQAVFRYGELAQMLANEGNGLDSIPQRYLDVLMERQARGRSIPHGYERFLEGMEESQLPTTGPIRFEDASGGVSRERYALARRVGRSLSDLGFQEGGYFDASAAIADILDNYEVPSTDHNISLLERFSEGEFGNNASDFIHNRLFAGQDYFADQEFTDAIQNLVGFPAFQTGGYFDASAAISDIFRNYEVDPTDHNISLLERFSEGEFGNDASDFIHNRLFAGQNYFADQEFTDAIQNLVGFPSFQTGGYFDSNAAISDILDNYAVDPTDHNIALLERFSNGEFGSDPYAFLENQLFRGQNYFIDPNDNFIDDLQNLVGFPVQQFQNGGVVQNLQNQYADGRLSFNQIRELLDAGVITRPEFLQATAQRRLFGGLIDDLKNSTFVKGYGALFSGDLELGSSLANAFSSGGDRIANAVSNAGSGALNAIGNLFGGGEEASTEQALNGLPDPSDFAAVRDFTAQNVGGYLAAQNANLRDANAILSQITGQPVEELNAQLEQLNPQLAAGNEQGFVEYIANLFNRSAVNPTEALDNYQRSFANRNAELVAVTGEPLRNGGSKIQQLRELEQILGYQTGGLVGNLQTQLADGRLNFNQVRELLEQGIITRPEFLQATTQRKMLGGMIQKFRNGGRVRGPGTGTSDSILANLSNGEFVVNADATRQHLDLLRSINDGTPGFQSGGLVGSPGSGGSSSNGGTTEIVQENNVTIQVGPGARPAQVADSVSREFQDMLNRGALDAGGSTPFPSRRLV